jgi:hypothetical protein
MVASVSDIITLSVISSLSAPASSPVSRKTCATSSTRDACWS